MFRDQLKPPADLEVQQHMEWNQLVEWGTLPHTNTTSANYMSHHHLKDRNNYILYEAHLIASTGDGVL